MGKTNKKAATEKISRESVQTNAAKSSQQQTTTPDRTHRIRVGCGRHESNTHSVTLHRCGKEDVFRGKAISQGD